jgi:hypothetical protein
MTVTDTSKPHIKAATPVRNTADELHASSAWLEKQALDAGAAAVRGTDVPASHIHVAHVTKTYTLDAVTVNPRTQSVNTAAFLSGESVAIATKES